MVTVFSTDFIRFPFLHHTFNSLTDQYVQIKMVEEGGNPHYLNIVVLLLTLKEIIFACIFLFETLLERQDSKFRSYMPSSWIHEISNVSLL